MGNVGHLNKIIMHYVYILQSVHFPDQNYIGQTDDVNRRLYVHNTGGSPHTAKYKPWKLISSISFESKEKAIEFEKYLKSGSGRVLIKKRFL
jgi:predicted GIY-YIG superfamily endonuclease